MAGERLAPGGLRLLFRRTLSNRLLGRLGALFERAPLFALDNGRRRRWRSRDGHLGLALLALRYSEQLADALVEARELLDELSILLDELRELSTLLGILLPQRFQLVHRRVQITLGDLCRSSSALSRDEVAGTSRAARQ